MDVFQHVSDVDIHLVNMEDLETRRYFESPPSQYFLRVVCWKQL